MSNLRANSDGQKLIRDLARKGGVPTGTRKGLLSPQGKQQAPMSSNHETKLRARLKTAEDTLRAIQSGEVDALMVSGKRGVKVVSLKGGEPSYRMLVEAMNEGAVALSWNGEVLYCNRSFAEMVGGSTGKLNGVMVQTLVAEKDQDRFQTLLVQARKAAVKGEFDLRCSGRRLIPVYLSLNRFRGFKGLVLGMVITDLSEQRRKQEEESKRAGMTHRLLLKHTLTAQEDERRRIARELHDEAGQLLTALLVGLRTLEDTRVGCINSSERSGVLPSGAKAQCSCGLCGTAEAVPFQCRVYATSSRKLADVRSQGHRLREIAAQAIDEVGRLARGLHPTVLDDHGLGVALGRYAAEYAKSHKIAVELRIDELDSNNLSSTVQIVLYRILQEALTNVARHSRAKAVSIRLTRLSAAIEVEVVDDGCGFDAESVSVSSHRLGIHSMRERAAMLGGTVSFISQRKGTRILVQVPVAGEDSELDAAPRNS